MRERVWSLGSELRMAAARPGHARPGLRLSAHFGATLAAPGSPAGAAG